MDRIGAVCPVCGDPGPYVLWIDNTPPVPPCPYGAHSVASCSYQQDKIRAQKARLKVCPDLLDGHGNVLLGQFGALADRMVAAGLDPMTGSATTPATPSK